MKQVFVDYVDVDTGEVLRHQRKNFASCNDYFSDWLHSETRELVRISRARNIAFQFSIKDIQEEEELF